MPLSRHLSNDARRPRVRDIAAPHRPRCALVGRKRGSQMGQPSGNPPAGPKVRRRNRETKSTSTRRASTISWSARAHARGTAWPPILPPIPPMMLAAALEGSTTPKPTMPDRDNSARSKEDFARARPALAAFPAGLAGRTATTAGQSGPQCQPPKQLVSPRTAGTRWHAVDWLRVAVASGCCEWPLQVDRCER